MGLWDSLTGRKKNDVQLTRPSEWDPLIQGADNAKNDELPSTSWWSRGGRVVSSCASGAAWLWSGAKRAVYEVYDYYRPTSSKSIFTLAVVSVYLPYAFLSAAQLPASQFKRVFSVLWEQGGGRILLAAIYAFSILRENYLVMYGLLTQGIFDFPKLFKRPRQGAAIALVLTAGLTAGIPAAVVAALSFVEDILPLAIFAGLFNLVLNFILRSVVVNRLREQRAHAKKVTVHSTSDLLLLLKDDRVIKLVREKGRGFLDSKDVFSETDFFVWLRQEDIDLPQLIRTREQRYLDQFLGFFSAFVAAWVYPVLARKFFEFCAKSRGLANNAIWVNGAWLPPNFIVALVSLVFLGYGGYMWRRNMENFIWHLFRREMQVDGRWVRGSAIPFRCLQFFENMFINAFAGGLLGDVAVEAFASNTTSGTPVPGAWEFIGIPGDDERVQTMARILGYIVSFLVGSAFCTGPLLKSPIAEPYIRLPNAADFLGLESETPGPCAGAVITVGSTVARGEEGATDIEQRARDELEPALPAAKVGMLSDNEARGPNECDKPTDFTSLADDDPSSLGLLVKTYNALCERIIEGDQQTMELPRAVSFPV